MGWWFHACIWVRMVKVNQIEARKENLAPRPQGWDLRLLANETVNVDTSDPLAVKLAELSKLRTAHCSLTVPKPLVNEYKQFIDEFKSWDMYKNDLRFVRVCIEYAHFCQEPELVFAYMQHHKLGQFCALFYLSWSQCLTAKGNSTMAQSVIQTGIATNAQPISILEAQLSNEFQTATAVQTTSSTPAELAPAEPAPEESAPAEPATAKPVVLASKRKRKFAIYTDEEPASSVPTNDTLPDFVAEKKENSTQGEKFVVAAPQTLNVDALDSSLADRSTLSDAEVGMLTYNERMLFYRKFTTPMARFGCRRLKEAQHLKTTAIISHDERLYVNHLGHSEVLGQGDTPGDTEVLKN